MPAANHKAIFADAGFKVAEYPYYYPETRGLDLKGVLNSLQTAPNGSIFLLHSCAHNPTGVDPTVDEWKQIGAAMKVSDPGLSHLH